MRIGKELETYGRILEVVFAVVLCHPRSFDPRVLLFVVWTASVEDGEDHVVVPSVLESMVLVVSPEEDLRLRDLLECHWIELYDLERHELRPSVEHVKTSVVIKEHVCVAVAVAVECACRNPFS